jgi:hypothetical protein
MTGIPNSAAIFGQRIAGHPTAVPLSDQPSADFDRFDFFRAVAWNLIGIDTHEPTLYGAALMMGSRVLIGSLRRRWPTMFPGW